MPSPPGLRTQLLVGLTLVFLVASASAGGITYWASRSRQMEERLASVRLLGEGLSALIGPALQEGSTPALLPQLLRRLGDGPLVHNLIVVNRQGRLLAGQPAHGSSEAGLTLTATQPQLTMVEGPPRALRVLQPVIVEGQLLGAIRFESPIAPGEGWPRLFWVLLAFDSALVLLFVALVLTRYVIRPLQTMQRAARQVAGGDLQVRLQSSGARELASLADSFNQMTTSVQEQLARLAHQQDELRTSREQLIRSEKLASVGRLAAGVAHEVGNPLQSIIGFSEMLLGGDLSPEESRDFLQRTSNESQRIHQIIRDLLDFARPVEEAVEPVRLDAVVEQSIQLVGPQRRLKEVSIEHAGLGELPAVTGSGPRLVQVLVNILLNAADAMQGRGEVRIEGRPDDGHGLVELRVRNSGPLISAELRGRIFDPFFTTKEPGQGTGLGLSVAQSIIESYGGRLLLLEGEPQTTFALLLHPFREDPRPTAEGATPDPRA